MKDAASQGPRRICVKLYAGETGIGDQVFVPIFQEWIRDQALEGLVLFDVADYAHVPDSPGIVLVTHETSFAMDRSDGRFGLLAQRRVGRDGDSEAMMASTLRQALQVAAKLESDPRLAGKLAFDRSTIRVESNDRLRAPNTDEGYCVLEAVLKRAVAAALPGKAPDVKRVANDPRDRLTVDVKA